MDIKEVLCKLSEADYIGGVGDAVGVAEGYLSQYADCNRNQGNLIGFIDRKAKKTVLLEAHIDEIGFAVVDVAENGFVKLTCVGGIDCRMLAGMKVKIYGKQPVLGVFCSVPPHLSKEDEAPKPDELYVDTGLFEKAVELISLGDRAVFSQSFSKLQNSRVTGKALDNRAGVTAVLRAVDILKGKDVGVNLAVLFSDQEEVTATGAVTQSFTLTPDEALVVDVSFGKAPGVPSEKSGELGRGPMIGVSPQLSMPLCDRVRALAEQKNIPYSIEVMGGKTGTDADVIASTRGGVGCVLLSVPLRNMHTPVEIIDIEDIENTARLISEFVLTR